MNLEKFFKPKSIAIIGASRSKEKIGFQILANLMNSGFPGKIYPVNPHADSILKYKAYKSVLDIQKTVDLAVIVIPAPLVKTVLEESGQKGIKHVVIISSGFKETNPEGETLETEIKDIAAKYKISVLGPNCLGIISPSNKLNASFAKCHGENGNISFVSQSGALGSAFLDWANKESFGFANFVSLGNKSDVSENELLAYFTEDPETKVIALYLESLKDGRSFLKIAKETVKEKPVIIFKSGKTPEGKAAVTSHTGVLAGKEEAFRAAMLGAGVIESQELEDFFDLLKTFSIYNNLRGENIAVITNAGGPGVITTDFLIKEGLKLHPLKKENKTRLQSLLPAEAALNNPIDILGDATSDRYKAALEITLRDEGQDAVIVIMTPQTITDTLGVAQVIIDASRKSSKPVLPCFMGGKSISQAKSLLKKAHIPTFDYPERAIKTLKAMRQLTVLRKKSRALEENKTTLPQKTKEKSAQILKNLTHFTGRFIPELLTIEIASAYGLKIPKTKTVTTLKNALNFLKAHKSIVLKISSPTTPHRTKVNGIFLNLDTEKKVHDAFKTLSRMEGTVIAQKMVAPGTEIIIGAKKDADFGYLLMFGTGGVNTEIYKDIAFAVTPLSKKHAKDLIDRTKVGEIIKTMGMLQPVTKTIVFVSQLLENHSEIEELDINPLIVNPGFCQAVDVKIRI